MTASDDRINLGSVRDVLAGRLSSSLRLDKLNTYALAPTEGDDDVLICEVFLKSESSLPVRPDFSTSFCLLITNSASGQGSRAAEESAHRLC